MSKNKAKKYVEVDNATAVETAVETVVETVEETVETPVETVVETTAVAEVKPLIVARVIEATLLSGECKTRKECAEKVVSFMAGKGQKQNNKGHDITVEHVTQEVSAVIRDIKTKTRGWHSTYLVIEDKDGLKIEKKPELMKA